MAMKGYFVPKTKGFDRIAETEGQAIFVWTERFSVQQAICWTSIDLRSGKWRKHTNKWKNQIKPSPGRFQIVYGHEKALEMMPQVALGFVSSIKRIAPKHPCNLHAFEIQTSRIAWWNERSWAQEDTVPIFLDVRHWCFKHVGSQHARAVCRGFQHPSHKTYYRSWSIWRICGSYPRSLFGRCLCQWTRTFAQKQQWNCCGTLSWCQVQIWTVSSQH